MPEPDPKKTDESARYRYGLWVVFAGLAVILLSYYAGLKEYDKAADVSTALAPVTGVVGTLVGAYFGVQVGAAGKDKAEAARDKADETAKAALGALPEAKAEAVLQSVA